MGQEQIIKLLKKEKRPMVRKDIAKKLNINPNLISHLLKKLLLQNEIKCVELDRYQARAYCRNKCASRRLRLYYA